MDDAINKLNKNIIFILATPPKIHEVQILKLINNGFSVITEKPCFVTLKNLKEFSKINFFKINSYMKTSCTKRIKALEAFLRFFKKIIMILKV